MTLNNHITVNNHGMHHVLRTKQQSTQKHGKIELEETSGSPDNPLFKAASSLFKPTHTNASLFCI